MKPNAVKLHDRLTGAWCGPGRSGVLPILAIGSSLLAKKACALVISAHLIEKPLLDRSIPTTPEKRVHTYDLPMLFVMTRRHWVHQGSSNSTYLILCDHAATGSRALGSLGLEESAFERQIGWTSAHRPGRELARTIDAVLCGRNYSRLVIDCNGA